MSLKSGNKWKLFSLWLITSKIRKMLSAKIRQKTSYVSFQSIFK